LKQVAVGQVMIMSSTCRRKPSCTKSTEVHPQ